MLVTLSFNNAGDELSINQSVNGRASYRV